MSIRQMEAWHWGWVKSQLVHYRDAVVFAWAALSDGTGGYTPLAATVRCGETLDDCQYTYERLALGRETLRGGQAVWKIDNGHLLPKGDRAPIPSDSEGVTYRVTGTSEFGQFLPGNVARYYFNWTWERPQSFSEAIFDEPLSSSTEPWFPTAGDAISEILFGRARRRHAFDWGSRLSINVPYGLAYIQACDLVDNETLVVEIAGSASGHKLHAAWQLHPLSAALVRDAITLHGPGSQSINIGGTPIFWSIALIDQYGHLVDHIDQEVQRRSPDTGATHHPPIALPEAFDSIDMAWRLAMRRPLFERPQLSSVADLALPVDGREDFMARLTSLATVLDSAHVDPTLLPESDRETSSRSLQRMKLALGFKLSGPNQAVAIDAVDQLRAVVQLRVAFQHKVTSGSKSSPDLETALARLNIEYPPNPSIAWEVVRRIVLSALSNLRVALRSSID